MAASLAVLVQDACKSYGSKEILKGLCMQVPKGSIYGLLGASGCGKTTLLSCIVGRKPLDAGSVWVLGGLPGTEGCGVPGPKVGFMPQEIALVGEFTVEDAIFYFGRIYHMSDKVIKERLDNLSSLLELPPNDRLIKNCSGGQQRRISFAASMVHNPELLILDEPTVGVDPILRERIWAHLVEIAHKSKIAVIITTHYIEEARQANVIGLMRDGRLLAEESPTKLLSVFQTDYLEEVFLILSQRQNEGRLGELKSGAAAIGENNIQNSSTVSIASLDTTQGSTDVLARKEKAAKKVGGYSLNGKRVKALLDKNWKQFYRNVSGMIFILLFPVIQNCVFLSAIGRNVVGIDLGVVNQESWTTLCPDFNPEGTAVGYSFSSCHFRNMSCRFLQYLEHPMIRKVQYDTLPEAIEAVKHGQVVGALYMAENFTESLEVRMEQGRDVNDQIMDFSEVKVWMDMSNRQIGYTVKYKLLEMFRDFQKALLKDCNLQPEMTDFFHLETIYGDRDAEFTIFMTPGLILTIMFFMMTIMTSQIIITDRTEGVWDRSIIAGVSSLEITLTHFIIQTGIVFVYTLEVLVITFVFFKIEFVGDLWILYIITFLQGIAGMGFGFWISVISYNCSMANLLTTGSFYIMILLSGLMWPVEGMPLFLQWISKCLPFTIASFSFRNVMAKGWPMSHLEVVNGVGIEIIWIILLGVINTMLIRSKR